VFSKFIMEKDQMTHPAFNFLAVDPMGWSGDWIWGLPLIVLTVIIHVAGLGFTGKRTVRLSGGMLERDHPTLVFVMIVATTTLLATCLHAIEAGIWAGAYTLLDALPDSRSAMLYSLSAMTSYGHEHLVLEGQWQLLGALESLDGWLLFGLTAAFLIGVIQKVWLLSSKEEHR
jgi:hypothetical protein